MQFSSYAHVPSRAWAAAAGVALGLASDWRRAGARNLERHGNSRLGTAACAALAVAAAIVASPMAAVAQEATRYATVTAPDVLEGENLVFSVAIREASIPSPSPPSISTITYTYSVRVVSGPEVLTSNTGCTAAAPCDLSFEVASTGTETIEFTTMRSASSEVDTVVEVILNSPTGHFVGPDGSTTTSDTFTANVLNVPTVTVSLTPSPVVEGQSLTLTFESSGAVKRATDLMWNLMDAACPSPNAGLTRAVAADFDSFPSSRTIGYVVDDPMLTKTATLTPTVAADNAGETAECVAIEVTNPANSGVVLDGTDANGRVYAVIQDLPVVTVSVPTGGDTVEEGMPAVFTLTRAGVTTGMLTVQYLLAASDGALPADAPTEGNAVFTGNDTTVEVSIPTADDETDEANGSVNLLLAGDGTAFSHGTPNNSSVTITDDDMPTLEAVAVRQSASASEGETFRINVSVNRESYQEITVDYEISGTGTGITAADFGRSSLSGSLTIPVNSTVPVPLDLNFAADGQNEADERFTVNFTATRLAGALGMARVTGVINATPVLSIGNAATGEGGTLSFPVTVDPANLEPITMSYQIGGTGITASDFVNGLTGTFTVPASSTFPVSLDVAVVSDSTNEPTETAELTLTVVTGEVTLPSTPPRGTIFDGDTPVVSVGDAPDVMEGSDLEFPVSVQPASRNEIEVTFTLSTGTGGVEDSDFQSIVRTLTIGAGKSSATFALSTAMDGVDERDEQVTVTIAGVPTGVEIGIGAAGMATGTIRDGDVPVLSFTVGRVTEGQALTVTAEVNPVSIQSITFEYALDTTSEATADDFVQPPTGTWTIGQGRSTQRFSLPTALDGIAEESEPVVLRFSNVLPRGAAGIAAAAETVSGSINDSLESALSAPRREGAAAALRYHIDRFQRLSSSIAMSRLESERARELQASGVDGIDQFSFVSGFSDTASRSVAWGAMSYGRIAGDVDGKIVDGYAGFDVLGSTGNHVLGWMVGYEDVDAEVGEADYDSGHFQTGTYGAFRFGEDMVFDGAITWGTGHPKVRAGTVQAKSRSERMVMRADLTGGLEWQFADVSVESQVGALYARQNLKEFRDSGGATGPSDRVSVGRLQAGALMRWTFRNVRFTGNPRLYWDNHRFGEERQRDLAMSMGGRASIDTVALGEVNVHGAVDGIGIAGHYRSYILGIEFKRSF